LNKKTPLDNNASSEAPVEFSRSESINVPEFRRERHPTWALHDGDDSGDRVNITSPPKSPKADLGTHTSALKSLSPDPGDCARITSPPKSPKADPRTHTSAPRTLSPDATMSNDSVSRRDDRSKEAVRAEDDSLFQLNKSNSVVAKVSMFAQLEEDMKRAAKETKSRKLPNASNRCMARREDVSQSGNRFATQPVTMGEVEEAVRSASSRDPDSTLAGMSNKLVAVWECVLARKVQAS